VYITVDALGKIMQKPKNYTITSLKELIGLAQQFRVELQLKRGITLDDVRALIAQRRPIIALVWYPLLPIKYDANYANGHYVVIVGVAGETVYWHDPYFRGQAGALLSASWADFSKAWSKTGEHSGTARQGLVCPPVALPKVELDKEAIKDVRWWSEEAVRAVEAGNMERARQILLNETVPRLYELEGKAA